MPCSNLLVVRGNPGFLCKVAEVDLLIGTGLYSTCVYLSFRLN